jgi:hypothetical protein
MGLATLHKQTHSEGAVDRCLSHKRATLYVHALLVKGPTANAPPQPFPLTCPASPASCGSLLL